jgi:uncharacterized iron-regulated membrane protein
LHIPEFKDIHWGVLLLGVIALMWTIDCFIGFYLTLPRRRQTRKSNSLHSKRKRSYWQRWRPAWQIRHKAGSYKLNFDLHRAFGLWTWVLLFVIAFTGFSLNLYREVFFPLMTLVSDVSPTPIDSRTPAPHHQPIEASFGFEKAISLGKEQAQERNWQAPVGSLWYAREFGIYRLEFFSAEEGHGAGGVGHNAVYIDAKTGEYLGDWQPWQGSAADLFVQAQFPLHSGRILGLPGRILISIMGVVVAMLSVTGIIIWWLKRRARVIARKPQSQYLPSELSANIVNTSAP